MPNSCKLLEEKQKQIFVSSKPCLKFWFRVRHVLRMQMDYHKGLRDNKADRWIDR